MQATHGPDSWGAFDLSNTTHTSVAVEHAQHLKINISSNRTVRVVTRVNKYG